MTLPAPPSPPARIESALSRILTAGVLLAAALAAFGGVLYLLRRGSEHRTFSTFSPVSSDLTTPASILRSALNLDPAAIMQLAVVVLIATPVLRVAASLVLFLLQRDFLYVLVTLIVLAALVFGFWGGMA